MIVQQVCSIQKMIIPSFCNKTDGSGSLLIPEIILKQFNSQNIPIKTYHKWKQQQLKNLTQVMPQ